MNTMTRAILKCLVAVLLANILGEFVEDTIGLDNFLGDLCYELIWFYAGIYYAFTIGRELAQSIGETDEPME